MDNGPEGISVTTEQFLASRDHMSNSHSAELSEDDVAELLARACAPYAGQSDSGLTAWCRAHGVSKGHASEFANRKRKPCGDLLAALGVRAAYIGPSLPPSPAMTEGRKPLDFTRPLELVCDGTEVYWNLNTLCPGFWVQRVDQQPFSYEQSPYGPDDVLWIDGYGRAANNPTGPQIVCNRAHGWDAASVEAAFPGSVLTPAAPEPDGEVVSMRQALQMAGCQLAALGTPDDEVNNAVLALIDKAIGTPPPPSSATPVEEMVGSPCNVAELVEEARVLLAARMREVDRKFPGNGYLERDAKLLEEGGLGHVDAWIALDVIADALLANTGETGNVG